MKPDPRDSTAPALPPPTGLDEVSRREAWFRLKVTQDFLVLSTQLKAHKEKIESLRAEVEDRDTRIHELHLAEKEKHFAQNAQIDAIHAARVAHKQSEQALHADLEAFMQRLRAAEDAHAEALARIGQMKSSWGWSLTAPLRRWQKKFAPSAAPAAPADTDLPGGPFAYYLHTSPFRLYRDEHFTLRGWVFPTDGRAVTAVRARLAGKEFLAQHGLDEPEVIAQHGPQPHNPRPGFSVELAIPPGRHQLRLEAELAPGEWLSFLSTPVWCEPAP